MSVQTMDSLRPRVAEAVRIYDSLPQSEKKYKTVAERMGITEGRAAVYVRQGLVDLGRGDETPRGGASHGSGGGGVSISTVPEFAQQMSDLIQRNLATADALQTQITEATEAVEKFDPEQYVADEIARQEKAITEAMARLEAWQTDKDEIATQAAEVEAKRLSDRSTGLSTGAAEQIANAQTAAEQALAFLRSQGFNVNDDGGIIADEPEGEQPATTTTPEEQQGDEQNREQGEVEPQPAA